MIGISRKFAFFVILVGITILLLILLVEVRENGRLYNTKKFQIMEAKSKGLKV